MTNLNQGLNRFLHSLLPATLRTSLKPNTAAYIRARALTLMLLATTGFVGVYSLYLTVLHVITTPGLLLRDILVFGALAFLVFQTAMFYRHCNYWLAGLVFTNFYLIAVMLILILNGGYSSAGKSILLTCPLISFVVGSRQEGVQHAVVAMIFFSILVFLHEIGFILPDNFSGQNAYIIFAMNWLFTMSVIALTLMVYEAELADGERRRMEKSLQANRRDTDRYGMRAVGRQFEVRLHQMLPTRLKATLAIGSLIYTRAQILMILLTVATIMRYMASFLVVGVDVILKSPQIQYDIWILVFGPYFTLHLWLFYHVCNVRLSGIILGYSVFGLIIAIVLLTGGYQSPMLLLLLIASMGFFMTNGMRAGIYASSIIAVVALVLCWADFRGVIFTDWFHDEAQPITAAIIFSITIVTLMACMVAYDSRLEKL